MTTPAATTPWTDAADGVGDPALAALCRDAWEAQMRAEPVYASQLGDARYHGALAEDSPEAAAREADELREFLLRAREIDDAQLSESDRITLALLEADWRIAVELHELRIDESSWNLDTQRGIQVSYLNLTEDQPIATARERAQLLERWSAMPDRIDQARANLARGLAAGRVTSKNAAVEVLEQLERLLSTPVEKSPLVARAAAADLRGAERDAFVRSVTEVVAARIYPSFARYRDFVRDEILPRARSDEQPGVVHVAGGRELYRLEIARHTSLDLSPQQIHDFGLAEVARIRSEIAKLGERVFGTSDVAQIQRRLRTDPALHFADAASVQATAEATLRRAEAIVPKAFGRLPKAPCVVVPIPEHEAPFSTVAYYREPAADGSRPGRYYVNTHEPTTRPRYEAEVLALHEAVPGHHLQIAIAQELEGLPLVRRYNGSTAYVEGWALYTERLGDELGLYSSDVDRLGVLSYDAWRACRLVVDTGIHAFGWSRARAIEYMVENTLLAENNVANEVDRYIGWPGQALAYKLGQREILALRARAQQELGPRFRLADFHDRVLENGAVSLAVLRAHIERWIAREKRGAT
ncbi:MAG: DUF885 domain-containing protein [Planctomycetota bacterium]